MHDGTEANPTFQHPDASTDRNATVEALDLFLEEMLSRDISFVSMSSVF